MRLMKRNFHEKLQHAWRNSLKRNIRIVMEDVNVKIDQTYENREKNYGKVQY